MDFEFGRTLLQSTVLLYEGIPRKVTAGHMVLTCLPFAADRG